MKPVISIESAAGHQLLASALSYGHALLVFDNGVVVIDAFMDGDAGSDYPGLTCLKALPLFHWDSQTLVRLGIMTDAELTASREEWKRKAKAEQDAADRRHYEALCRRFDSVKIAEERAKLALYKEHEDKLRAGARIPESPAELRHLEGEK